LYVRHISRQVLNCALFEYADDSSLVKVIRRKEDRRAAADELMADINRVFSWGKVWSINFEPAKCHSLCISLKHDIDSHPPLLMDSFSIQEVDSLKILGFHFDCRLTWSSIIGDMATRCQQRKGALYHVQDYLGVKGLAITFKSFVRPICGYGNVAIMGALASQLSKLDAV